KQARSFQSIAVALPLEPATQSVLCRHQHQPKYGQDQYKERQRRRIGVPRIVQCRGGMAENKSSQPEGTGRQDDAHNHHFPNVSMNMMSAFMSEADGNFVRSELIEQRIPQQYPPSAPQSCQGRVCLAGLCAEM